MCSYVKEVPPNLGYLVDFSWGEEQLLNPNKTLKVST